MSAGSAGGHKLKVRDEVNAASSRQAEISGDTLCLGYNESKSRSRSLVYIHLFSFPWLPSSPPTPAPARLRPKSSHPHPPPRSSPEKFSALHPHRPPMLTSPLSNVNTSVLTPFLIGFIVSVPRQPFLVRTPVLALFHRPHGKMVEERFSNERASSAGVLYLLHQSQISRLDCDAPAFHLRAAQIARSLQQPCGPLPPSRHRSRPRCRPHSHNGGLTADSCLGFCRCVGRLDSPETERRYWAWKQCRR